MQTQIPPEPARNTPNEHSPSGRQAGSAGLHKTGLRKPECCSGVCRARPNVAGRLPGGGCTRYERTYIGGNYRFNPRLFHDA
jgi:hypothetical protein